MPISKDPDDDLTPAEHRAKKLSDILDQLQMLEYAQYNVPGGLTEDDKKRQQQFEQQKQRIKRQQEIFDKPKPINDNQNSQEPWLGAELILQAYARISGHAAHPFDAPQAVIADLLKDLMHYCKAMSEGEALDSPNRLDFDHIARFAKQEFIGEQKMFEHAKAPTDHSIEVWKLSRELQAVQNATDGPFSEKDKKRIGVIETILNAEPDLQKLLVNLDIRQQKEFAQTMSEGRVDTEMPKRHEDERQRYITDYKAAALTSEPAHVQNPALKTGAPMPEDENFIAKVQFIQDPEYIKLERDLQLRQEQEHKKLLDQQTQQRIDFGKQPGVTKEMLDENYKQQLKARDELGKQHSAEHKRYTREYHDAKVMRQEMEAQEKTLTQGLEDTPKHTI
jgi:hypothetical protein